MRKTRKLIIVFVLLFNLFQLKIINSQSDYCNMPSLALGQSGSASVFVGGLYKPHRTDLSGGIPVTDSTARLNVLAVFVQFANESLTSDDWPIGDRPNFMDSVLAIQKHFRQLLG